jgi:CHAT domain-containing protein/tetratricopeptide (TPR) repeat protein
MKALTMRKEIIAMLVLSLFAARVAAQNKQSEVCTLVPGQTVEREIAGGEAHSYVLTLRQGQFLRAVANSTDIDIVVTLIGPGEEKLLTVDLLKYLGPEPLSFVADKAGEYRLEIRADAPATLSGHYQLTSQLKVTSETSDTERLTAERLLIEANDLERKGSKESLQASIDKRGEALLLWRNLGDRYWEAYSLHYSGRTVSSLGKNQEALELLNQALKIREEIGDRIGEATTLNNLGLIYRSLGEKRKALDYYNQALTIRRAVGDKSGEADTLISLGLVYRSMGENQKALHYYNQALPIKRAVGDKSGEAGTLNNLGLVSRSLGEKQKALDFYNQALTIRRAMGDKSGEAGTLHNLGTVYGSTGENEKALDYYNQALTIRRAVGDKAGEADTLIGLGLVYRSMGENQKALDYYNQALPVKRAVGDKAGEANTLNILGIVYWSMGENQKALDFYNQALPVTRAVGDKVGEANILNNLGNVYERLGEKQKALDYYTQDLPIYRAVGNKSGEAVTLNNLGSVYWSMRKNQEALESLNQALKIRKEIGDRIGEASTLNNLGLVYRSMGEKQKALDSYNQALTVTRAVGDKVGEANTLRNLAQVERDQGKLTGARAHLESALNIIEEVRRNVTSQELRASYVSTVQSYFQAYIDLLMQLHQQGPTEGFDALALQASERGRARSLIELLNEAHADIRQGAEPRLLERERSLQRLFNVKTERQIRLLSGPHTDEQAAEAAKEIEGLKIEYQQLETEIKAKSPRYAALTQPQPLSAEQIQHLLDKDTLLLEYSLGNEHSYLWAVTESSVASYELPKRAEIEAAAKRFYQRLTAPNLMERSGQQKRGAELVGTESTGITEATSLSQIVLGSVASQLGNKRLVIVADGGLQYVPFGALPAPMASGQSAVVSKTYRPLILDHEIVNLPSASTLAVIRRETEGRRAAEKTVAILADPVFDADDPRVTPAAKTPKDKTDETNSGSIWSLRAQRAAVETGDQHTRASFERLLGTRQEAERISSLAGTDVLKALDFDASRATAESATLAQYRYVHFATHGFLNSSSPELSGVVLSLVDPQGKPQNGFVLADEIFNLRLNADLVVLSACQTGLGKEVKGEGLVGLTRGFMYAGSPRVIVSLWSVNDIATSELMGRLYQGILKKGMRPADALRAVQIQMFKQKQWRAPYFWAAFVLQGDWR